MGTSIKAVLFDLDDTLNDRSASWKNFVARLAHPESGHLGPCAEAEVHRLILAADGGGYRPKEEFIAELQRVLPWKTPMTADAIEAYWRTHFPACTATRPAVHELLGALRKRGIRTAIITNGRQDNQQAKIDHMGIGPLVDAVIISGALGVKKPDPRIYQASLDALQVTAADSVFVGDHVTSDIVGPARLGMRTVWLSNGRTWPTEHRPADAVLQDFADLGAILSALMPSNA